MESGKNNIRKNNRKLMIKINKLGHCCPIND